MRSYKFVALALVCVLLFSGCSLVSIDEERVNNQVVAVVNGEKIYYRDVDPEGQKEQMDLMLLYYYGMDPADMKADELKSMYDEQIRSALENLVLNALLLQKAAELNIALTDEEMAENRKQAEEYYQSEMDYIMEDVLATPAPSPTEAPWVEITPTPAAAPTATPDAADTQSAETDAADTQSAVTEATPTASPSPTATPSPSPTATPTPAPSPTATPEPTATPSLDAAQQAEVDRQYQEFIDASGTMDEYYEKLNKNDLITKVKEHINRLAAVTDDAALAWYNAKLEEQKAATEEQVSVFEDYVGNNNIITYVPEDTVAVKQIFFKFTDAELVEEATALYTNDQKELAFALLQSQIDALMPAAEEARERLANGENIDDLIAELGDDPGMDAAPGMTYGYLVSEGTTKYVKEFCDAARGLFSVGSISQPTVSYMGIHVLQSIRVYREGTIPFEDIRESIKTAMMPDAQTAKYDEVTKQWLSEAKITYYYKRLGLEG
jgi:hypothetical protein